jgi:hypothetical protein
MACISCGVPNQGKFLAEVDIHFPELRNVNNSPVLLYPELLVCLNCGKAEFTVPKDQLVLLAKRHHLEWLIPALPSTYSFHQHGS